MRISNSTRSLLAVALVFMPVYAFAQCGGGSGGGSNGVASSGGASGSATGAASGGAPKAGSPGAGSTAINGVTGPANPAGLNNSNDPSGAGNAAKLFGTNPARILQARPILPDLPLVPLPGLDKWREGRRRNWRIDGTITPGARLLGDDAIKIEDARDSKADKKIKSFAGDADTRWLRQSRSRLATRR